MPDRIGKGITPISRGMKYQQLSTPRDIDEEKYKNFKKYDVELNGRKITISYDGDRCVVIDGKMYISDVEEDEDGFFLASVEITKKQVHQYKIEQDNGDLYLEGRKVIFDFKPNIPKLVRRKSSRVSGEDILTPLPGTITAIPVRVGDKVEVGQKVAILEAMKMQNDILCSVEGVIKVIKVSVGDQVSNDQLILRIGSK